MTLSHGHYTPLGHGQQLYEILTRSNVKVRSNDPNTDFGYMCNVILTSRDMTLIQCHYKPFRHGQKLHIILIRSNMAVRSYGFDTYFWYVCTVTLTLQILP